MRITHIAENVISSKSTKAIVKAVYQYYYGDISAVEKGGIADSILYQTLDVFFEILKSQCRKISRISNQFQKFQFWLIPHKHPFRGTLSRNDIKKSPSALHFENFRKVRKFAKNTFFNSENWCKFLQISTKQYKRAKAPIDLILLMYLADIHSFKTA